MFENDSDRRAWAREQMEKAGTPEDRRTFMEQLLGVFWSHATSRELSVEDRKKLLDDFSNLAQGYVLVPEPVEEEAIWVDARPGWLSLGDTIRVKADAYPGDTGLYHNGRPGVITAMRSGDIHVRYTDDKPVPPGFIRHSPYKLQKRVR